MEGDGVAIHVHVQPGAKRSEVVGVYGERLKLRLASPPIEGKANECLIEFLAERLGVKRAQVKITQGLSSRRKTVFVSLARFQPAVLLEQDGEKA